MFEMAAAEQRPDKRIELIDDELDRGGWTITDVLLLEDQGLQVDVLARIHGLRRLPDGTLQLDEHRADARDARITLRTVDGKPLGRVKVGLIGMSAREQRRAEQLGSIPGEGAYHMREFPAEFTVRTKLAVHLLQQWGYGIARPRWCNRHAEGREEKDAHGKPVRRIDRWRLVERGSSMERLAIQRGDAEPLLTRSERRRKGSSRKAASDATPETTTEG